MAFNLPSLRSVFHPSRRSDTDIDYIFNDLFDSFENQFKRSLLTKK